MAIKLSQFWQLQKQETPLVCLTEISSESVMSTIQDTSGMIAGTGTTGITTDGGMTTGGFGGTSLTIIIILLFALAHLADRWLNLKQDLDRELQTLQRQDNPENQEKE